MVDPVTPNLGLAIPIHGADVDTWDVPVNGDFSILDAIAGSVTAKSVSNVNINLSTTETQANILRFTGTVSGPLTVKLGAINKTWIIDNRTLNPGFFFTFIGNAGTGNVIMPPPGTSQIAFDGTNVFFVNLPPFIGQFADFGGASVPLWVTSCSVPPFLLCDGSTFSAGTYPLLNAVLNGTTLPDARGRSRFALDGGTNRLTSAGSGVDGNTRGASGGFQNITLDVSTLPSHFHTGTTGTENSFHTHNVPTATGFNSQFVGPGGNGWSGTGATAASGGETSLHTHDFSTSAAGGSAAHNNVPPAYVGGVTMIRAG